MPPVRDRHPHGLKPPSGFGRARRDRARLSTRIALEGKRDRAEGGLRRTIDLVIRSVIAEEDAKHRIGELKTQLSLIESQFYDEPPSTVALHPATLRRYIETVDDLSKALADHATATDDRGPLTQNFRGLVHSVTVYPQPARQGFEVEVKGKLAALIGGAAFPTSRHIGKPVPFGRRYNAAAEHDSGFEVVAGERYRLSPTPTRRVSHFVAARSTKRPEQAALTAFLTGEGTHLTTSS